MPKPKTIMVFSAHHNRIGFCFLIDRQPMDWQIAHVAAKSPDTTKYKIQEWLKFYSPDLVITEDCQSSSRKGRIAQRLILAIKQAVYETDIEHVEVMRTQPFANKYEQIDRLCLKYPQLKVVQPKKRKIYDPEPAYVTVFEAVVMAEQFLQNRIPQNLPT